MAASTSVPTPMPNCSAPVAGSTNQSAFQTSPVEDREHGDRQKQHVAMEVLQDERKRVLAPVALARLPDRARRRVHPERLVVGAAVVVAGKPEEAGNRQNQQRRRKWQPAGPARRLRAEPAMRRVAEDFRRVERREIRAVRVVSRPGTPPTSSRRGTSRSQGTRRAAGSTTRPGARFRQTAERSAGPVQPTQTCNGSSREPNERIAERTADPRFRRRTTVEAALTILAAPGNFK